MSAPGDGRGTTGTIFRVSGAHPPSSCADVVLRRCDIFPHTTPLLMLLLLLWLLVPGGHATSPGTMGTILLQYQCLVSHYCDVVLLV